MIRPAPRRRLLRRLFLGQVLVVLAGTATLGVVSFLVAPPIFHDHVRRAVGPVSDVVAHHLDTALSETLTLALIIGIVTAGVAAAGVSWILAKRIVRPVEELARTAAELATGHLSARAATPAIEDELSDLTTAFNGMADALEHVERTRRRLLADLAHELRTPLSTVEAYHEAIADDVVEPDASTIAILADATGRLRRLVDDVALVSLAEEGLLDLDLQHVDLAQVAADAIEAIRPAAREADVDVHLIADDSPVTADADPDRLGQVLGNLLHNALEHTPPGGTIRLEVIRADGHAQIAVTDSGAGIPAEHLPYIFQRFYRADPARRRVHGSGIGLTISRAILTRHGGQLTATSDGGGRGATFTLQLPSAAPPDHHPTGPDEQVAGGHAMSRRRVARIPRIVSTRP